MPSLSFLNRFKFSSKEKAAECIKATADTFGTGAVIIPATYRMMTVLQSLQNNEPVEADKVAGHVVSGTGLGCNILTGTKLLTHLIDYQSLSLLTRKQAATLAVLTLVSAGALINSLLNFGSPDSALSNGSETFGSAAGK